MIRFLAEKMIKSDAPEDVRSGYGRLAGTLGLVSNALLFAMKFFIGLTAGSVSIMADAINSLTDTASSVLTLVGFKIAAKPADKEHPYGHERFEYISGFMISIIITYVGVQFLQSSFEKILHPSTVKLNTLVFVILVLSILMKVWQSRMYHGIAKQINSGTLRATGQDALNDVITTGAVLVSAVVELLTGWRVDGYVGFLIALYIIYSGITMVKDFMDELMGSRPTPEEIQEMENRLNDYPDILGYHDLLVHSYGPQKRFASVHIEVDDQWDLNHAHDIIDRIEKDFHQKLDVELVCHLDPVAVQDPNFLKKREYLREILNDIDPALRMHDFRIEGEDQLSFDVVVPQKCKYSDTQLRQLINEAFAWQIGDQQLIITFDHNYLL